MDDRRFDALTRSLAAPKTRRGLLGALAAFAAGAVAASAQACPPGQTANRKGECRCPSGSVLCGGVCRAQASFASDSDNCGGCGVSCDDSNPCTDDTCAGGVCQNTPNIAVCTTAEGAAGTCANGGCVATTTTTTTTALPGPACVPIGSQCWLGDICCNSDCRFLSPNPIDGGVCQSSISPNPF